MPDNQLFNAKAVAPYARSSIFWWLDHWLISSNRLDTIAALAAPLRHYFSIALVAIPLVA
jgi:hypothetical protein